MDQVPIDRHKSLGSPFARPSRKPWLVDPSNVPWPLNAMAMTTLVFFRRSFGERFLTSYQLVRGAFHLALFAVAMRFIAGGWHFVLSGPVPTATWLSWLVFSLLFLVCTSCHLFAAARRRTTLRDEFSRSDGRPWQFLLRVAPFARDEWDVELYFEPTVCIALGGLLMYFHNWFGIYLVLAGYGLYLHASKKFDIRRALDLNVMDARIEMTHQPSFDEDPGNAEPTTIKSFDAFDDRGTS